MNHDSRLRAVRRRVCALGVALLAALLPGGGPRVVRAQGLPAPNPAPRSSRFT